MEILITIAIVLAVLLLALLIWLLNANSASRRELSAQSASINLLQQQLEGIKDSQQSNTQTLEKNLQTSQQSISQYLQTSQQTLTKLHKQIGQIEGANQQMLRFGTDVRKLQDILKSPKLRGQMGEHSLENLLTDILPKDSFSLQHQFKNGRIVDALVRMNESSVSIDAKFPLPGFEAMIAAPDDDQKAKLRRQFQRDITNHIDKIAAHYINPAEGTLDFALMYIPAENVYYETVIKYDGDKSDLMRYSLDKKVIAVSPNLLYAYLMTVVMGLHGMQIEKQAAQIRQNLKTLNSDFVDFVSNWDTLGSHLRNAYNKYDEGQRKLDKFGLQMTQIQTYEDQIK